MKTMLRFNHKHCNTMNFNFDEEVSRRGTESVKWDEFAPDTIPMWIADMDFKAAPAIREALQKRLDHGVFGYELVPDGYYDAITRWFSLRHGWNGFGRKDIIYTTSVISAYSACIKAMTRPGDKVIIMTPVYNCFFPAIRNNGCEASCSTLIYKDNRYSIDFGDLERRASDPRATVLLLCNPHNPGGRVWTREELERIGAICMKHDVFVISDEIHGELTYPGHDYTPYGTLAPEMVKRSATCVSPTKAFNIAGIQIANIIATDPEVYQKIDRAINENECCDVNVFGVTTLMAAYNGSGEWLDQLRSYLYDNAQAVYEFMARELPQIKVMDIEGTYLMWMDCRALLKEGEQPEGFSERLTAHLREKARLIVCCGTIYGEDGEGFIRFNIACPRSQVREALSRLKEGLTSY